jgi:hypothetical protein
LKTPVLILHWGGVRSSSAHTSGARLSYLPSFGQRGRREEINNFSPFVVVAVVVVVVVVVVSVERVMKQTLPFFKVIHYLVALLAGWCEEERTLKQSSRER